MYILKWIFYSFVAWGCSVTFFNSSIFAMIILTCILMYLSNNDLSPSVESKTTKIILIIGIVVGIVMIIVGMTLIQQDSWMIIGAAILAISLSVFISNFIYKCAKRFFLKNDEDKTSKS